MFESLSMGRTGDYWWHPWRHIRHHHPHIGVDTTHRLPSGYRGLLTRAGIYLDCRLSQAGRRCTLGHEIVHLERGPVPDHPHFATLEEHAVNVITARRLIRLNHLVDALTWTQHPNELAEELWVDTDTVTTRMQHLTTRERAYIESELAERQPWTV